MALYQPRHRQLDHPFIRNADISKACEATSACACHLASFADLLRLLARNQQERYSHGLVSWPPEVAARPIWEVAYGFSLLLVRHADLGLLIPELGGHATMTYPVRAFPEGKASKILIVDGWEGEASGLLTHTPNVVVRLDGTLADVEDMAWGVFGQLRVVLDASLRIQDLRGHIRGQFDAEGWTEIPGVRKAAGRFKDRIRLDPWAGF